MIVSQLMFKLLEDVYTTGRDSYSLDEKKISVVISILQVSIYDGSLDSLVEACEKFKTDIFNKTNSISEK